MKYSLFCRIKTENLIFIPCINCTLCQSRPQLTYYLFKKTCSLFAIHYSLTIADVPQCVSLCTLSSSQSSFFPDTTRWLLCKCFLFLFSPFYTLAGTQKLYQMVNLIIGAKEPNGPPSSLHASGSEKRSISEN